jgi:LysM repeat protein
MKHLSRPFAALVVLFVLGLLVLPASGQGQNLLRNPGFEETPFVTVPATNTTPEMQMAPGWERWHFGGGSSASQNVEPEYYPASDSTNGLGVPRIRNGSEAQQYLTFFATMDAGIYQTVTNIPANAQLRFSAYIYVWSSTLDDPNLSEDPGGVNIQVGIDPTGGTDAASTSVVWSQASSTYDAFNEYSVTAAASSSSVTVFVRSTVSTPIQSNNIYVDDASLVVLGSPSGGTTPTREAVTPSRVPATNTVGAATSAPSTPQATTVPPTVAQPTSVPATTQPQSTATSVVIPDEFRGRVVHVVQQGDTVDILARLYASDINYIISANGLNPTSALIRVGQVLVIPVRLASPATSTPRPTQPAPVATATTASSVPTSAPAATNAPQGNTSYVVRPGDTLSEIAARFNTTMSAIIQLNGITNPNNIRWGQRLIIPGAQSPAPTATPASPSSGTRYVVQAGDTLLRLSIRFGVSVSELVQANNIRNPDRLFVGQVLTIP